MKDKLLPQKDPKGIKTLREIYEELKNTDRQTFTDSFRIVTKIGKNGKKLLSIADD